MRKAYELYFGCKIGDQVKFWAPRICLFKAKISQKSEAKKKEGILLVHKLHNYLKTKSLVYN